MNHTANSTALPSVLLITAVALFGACEFGDQGPPNPAPNGGSEVGPSTSSGGQAGGPPVQPVKRTVETRNPFGDIVGNLLIDGDFEYSALIQGQSTQAGWYAFTDFGQQHIQNETGGLCKSGLRCGVLKAGVLLYGRGTAANGTGMLASVWIKPPADKDCSIFDVTVINCSFNGSGTKLPPVAMEPDAEGWCFYRNDMEESKSSICMLIDSGLFGNERAIVDAATILPDNGTAPRQIMKPLSSSKQARYARAARKVRDTTPFGAPPERPALIGDR